ncbi:uncharacterized protein LOC120179194 [Hibiscus syriacus]|uniref:uncharacterized protein LOC120179194 n=1 Tax=Hibiscus syriacus TaxID=106335 RepID=UPI001923DEE9|nr:uncharacterized protein LOC120179194 [Hibiscus syriacus]
MGNSLRCLLACVLPCGALDLIRIVHLNGHVEEITRPVTAAQILHANPNHILTKPSSQGVASKILISDSDHRSLLNARISETKRSGRGHRDRRNSRERVWQPHLASLSED